MSDEGASLLEQARSAAADGDAERVGQLFQRSRSTDSSEAELVSWSLLLAESGLVAEALAAARSIKEGTTRDQILRLLSVERTAQIDEENGLFEEIALERPAISSSARVVELFLRWFGGRRDIYARQWYDERRSRGGYRPVHEPFTASVVKQHLEGRITAGQYVLFPDATAAFGVIDLDLSAAALETMRSAMPDAQPLDHAGLRDYVVRIRESGAALGLPLFAEDSGGRGVHIWVFVEPRRPARAVRSLLAQVLAGAGAQPPDVGAEIFPKQDGIGPRGLSSLVKLPLGLHQATLRRCSLLGRDLQPIEDPVAALSDLAAPDPNIVDAILARRVLPFQLRPEESGTISLPPLTSACSPRSLGEALRALDGAPALEAADRMIKGCRILGDIVARAYEERCVSPDEARALIYSIGLIGRDGARAREALVAAGSSHKELERAQRGVHSPVGCKKLQRIGRNPGCDRCPSDSGARPYATPALFAVGPQDPTPPRHEPFAAWIDVAELAADPMSKIDAGLRRIEERLDRIEAKSEQAQPAEE